MKKTIFLKLLLALPIFGFSQESDTIKFDNDAFLSQISENACKCVDSVETYNKSQKEISAGINSCIDKQVMAYQLGKKLASMGELKTDSGQKQNINIEINSNPDSNDYKKFYYEIENNLMDTCPKVKNKIAANDKIGEKSMSNDSEALKYFNLGLDESKKEDFAKAIQYYKKAVVFDPEFVFAYDNMGICYRRLNQFDEAIDAYEKSLKIDPNGTMPLQNIGIAYLYKKEYKKAIKAYEKLAKLDNRNPEVFYGIGNIYAQYLFDYEKALDNLCQAYNLYIELKSPYRSDAEKLIQVVYTEMKKQGKEAAFNEILAKHHISQN
jgi:tetratricopeptide (TPR) repeat protein